MPLTDHQELAAESRGGARLVSAAAGSGKTKVLVERLMRYVDRGADIDQFLVITYTRAAAAELRSRIHSALGERIAADPMNRRLRRQTELCCRASIGTIDSICGRFLRENTHLAGISPDYRVIEPDRSDEICARVLDKLLEELYETIEEDAGVRALVDSFGSGNNDDKLSALVLRLYKSLQSHADPDAREIVYGMPYKEWQARYQKEATAEQKAKFAAATPGHLAPAARLRPRPDSAARWTSSCRRKPNRQPTRGRSFRILRARISSSSTKTSS